MLMSSRNHWIRNLLSRWGWMSPQRTRSRRRVLRGGHFQGPTAAQVETLESRQLLSGGGIQILVNDAGSGTNYATGVTPDQLNPGTTPVTLRDAVDASNNGEPGCTIVFEPSVFLPGQKTTIAVKGGPLELTQPVTIIGPDGAQVTVDGGNATTVFKVDAGVRAEIDGLTIAHGLATVTDSQGKTAGGAIYNAGNLILNNDVITASLADSGGSGGGIYNASGGNVTLQQSTVSDNKAPTGSGGGIYNDHGGMLTLRDDVIGHNTAANGGGISTQIGLTLVNSTITDNSTTAESGSHGGGIDSEGGDLIIINSTIAQNSASGSSSHGGGIQISNSELHMINSTLTNNSADTGGGIAVQGGNATVSNSTIAMNSADLGSGGVDNDATSFTLSASIVAGNVGGIQKVADDWGGKAASSASSYNLMGAAGSSGLTDGNNHNLVGTKASPIDPHLADLADNGGPTRTMALLTGSPALDAGGTTLPVDPLTLNPLTTDQRGTGFSRFSGAAIDIGAFEVPGIHAISAPDVTYGTDGQVHVTLDPSSGSGTLSLVVDGGTTFTKSVAAGDTDVSFDVGLLKTGTHTLGATFTATGDSTGSTKDGSLEVKAKTITPSFTASDKEYDGTTAAAVAASQDWKVGVDDVTLNFDPANFASRNVGQQTVTVTGLTLSGDDAGNYVLASTTAATSAQITMKSVTPSFTAGDKMYDGKTAATVAGSLDGLIGKDVVTLNYGAANFASKNVGTWTVTVTGLTLSGDDAGNYVLASTTATTSAQITVKSVTPSFTASDKAYDGTTTATVTASQDWKVGTEDVALNYGAANFASNNVGTWTVTVSGLSLTGKDVGNYVLASTTATTTASITARTLDAVLSTAGSINIAKNGTINFMFSNVSGALGGETLTQLFNGAQFSLTIGSAVYTGTSTVVVNNGTVTVSWQMNQQLYTDFANLLNGATGKVPESLTVSGTSVDGNYALSEDVLTTLFQQGKVTFA
jgi:hypothetical protein